MQPFRPAVIKTTIVIFATNLNFAKLKNSHIGALGFWGKFQSSLFIKCREIVHYTTLKIFGYAYIKNLFIKWFWV